MPTCTPGSTTTTHYGLCKPADGETNWGPSFRTNMDTLDAQIFAVSNAAPRSYLAGLQTTITQATTSVSIAVGVAMGNDQATVMVLGSTLVKVASSTWAVGTGNGGMTSATSIQANQTYHLHLIERTDTSVVDAYFDTSPTAANIPANYTIFRRIASIKTASTSAQIMQWTQDGDFFQWNVPVLETTAAAPGIAAVTQTLAGIPSGINALAVMNTANVGGAFTVYFSDLSTADIAASVSASPLGNLGGNNASVGVQQVWCRTNTTSQIRYRTTSNAQVLIVVTGFFDRRGRDQ